VDVEMGPGAPAEQILEMSEFSAEEIIIIKKKKQLNALSGNSKQFTFNKQRCHASI